MKRVLVIGSPGAGKSTFARQLGAVTGLPVVHLDRLFWKAGWVEPDKIDWRERVAEVLKGEKWIIDGNYGGTMEMRLAACDTVNFLDFSRFRCTFQVLKRVTTYRGKTRPDMADGCNEHVDLDFLKWTWQYPSRSRPNVLRRLAEAGAHARVFRFEDPRDANTYLQKLCRGEMPANN